MVREFLRIMAQFLGAIDTFSRPAYVTGSAAAPAGAAVASDAAVSVSVTGGALLCLPLSFA
jgi:hypothetical protein